MKKFIAIVFTVFAVAGCATVSEGASTEGPFTPFPVSLTDGRTIECISIATYDGNSVLECNWDTK